jgi:hypothetical protein
LNIVLCADHDGDKFQLGSFRFPLGDNRSQLTRRVGM